MKRTLIFAVLIGCLTLAKGQTISLTAQLTGANEVPPNDSLLTATANLMLQSPYSDSGVSNVLQGILAVPLYIFPEFLDLQIDAITFEDEAGNTVTNLAPFYSPPLLALPGTFSTDFWFALGQIIRPVVFTPHQVSQLLAGRWFQHVSATGTSMGISYPIRIRGRILPVDSDRDGVPDYLDACPGTSAGVVVSAQGCSIEQLCPCRGEWKSHGDYVTCVREVAIEFRQAGLISPAAERAVVKTAANSDCGRVLTPAAPFSGITGRSFLIPFPWPGVPGCDGCPGFDWSFATSIKVYTATGGYITELRTDTHGEFKIHLKQGDYMLVPWNPPPPSLPPVPGPFLDEPIPPIFLPYPCASPLEVVVPFKQFTNVVIYYHSCFGQ